MTKEMIFNNRFFNIFILFINTSVIDLFFKTLHIPPGIISAIRLLLNTMFIMVMIYYMLTRGINSKRYLFVIMLSVIIGVSILWTPQKFEAVKLYINFAGAICYFILLCSIAFKHKIIKSFVGYCNLVVIANIIVLTLVPSVGYMHDSPTLKIASGIHLSRSTLTLYMLFSMFIYIYYLYMNNHGHIEKLGIYFMILLNIAVILISKSSTGIVTIALFIPLLIITKSKALSKISMRIVLVIGIALPFIRFTSSTLDNIVKRLFGKTLTFSGRAYIWQYAIDKLTDNFLIGNGFNSTTYLLQNKVVPIYDRVASHTHNGFLELFLQNGMIGLVLGVIILLGAYRYSFRIKGREADILRIYLIIFIVFNFMEPYLIGNVSLVTLWLPVVYILTLGNRKMREKINE